MPEVPIQPYKRISHQTRRKHRWHTLPFTLDKQDICRAVFSFLIGRCQFFGMMTPFLLSYYAADFQKEKSFITLVFGTLGVLSTGLGLRSFQYVIAMLIYTLYCYVYSGKEHKKSLDLAMCFLTLFGGGYLFVALDGFVVYDTIFLAIESGICVLGFLWCEKAYPMVLSVLVERNKRRWILNREFICGCLFLSFLLAGIYQIASFHEFHLVNVFILLCVICLSYYQGVHLGVLAAGVCGCVIGLMGSDMVGAIGFFVLVALTAGALSAFGKVSSAVGIMISVLCASLVTSFHLSLFVNIYETLAGCLAFVLLPMPKWQEHFTFEHGVNPMENEEEFKRMQGFLKEKLNRTSDSFYHLSTTFNELSERRLKSCRGELNDVVTEVSKRVCKECSLFDFCWKKDFSRTYGNLYTMVGIMDEKGYVDPLDADEDLKEHCIHLKDMAISMNHLYEVYQINLHWTNQLIQNRQLISEQYHGIAKIMARLSSNVSRDITFQNDNRQKIMSELLKAHFHVDNVRVVEMGDERSEVVLQLKKRYASCEFAADAALHVSCVLRKSMTVAEDVVNGTRRILSLIEADKFRVTLGMASVQKDGSTVSGDSCDGYNLPDNHYVMALSDGMGSGAAAERESKATLALLKEFLRAGFDKQTAFGFINSALLLKSAEESFATIDLAMIQLTTGRCEFVKIGSATSFIKHLTDVECIHSTSLPAGILSSIDAELSARTLEDGDMIVLMSDGVLESNPTCAICEEWVTAFLSENRNILDPQELANKILKQALEYSHGVPKDDMTVLVSRMIAKQN